MALLRPPRQTRSRRTLDRIAAAALELMAEGGAEAVTVAAVVERAGTSVGAFYARFPGKEDLVLYLQDRIWTEARERWDEAFAAEDWTVLAREAVVDRVVGILFASLEGGVGPGCTRDPSPANGRQIVRSALDFLEHRRGSVKSLLLQRRSEIDHPDPEVAIDLGYGMVLGGIREALARGAAIVSGGQDGDASERGDPAEAPSGGGSGAGLVRELAKAWNAYLSCDVRAQGEPDKGAVDFFDPWG